jgi:hypothetical protein
MQKKKKGFYAPPFFLALSNASENAMPLNAAAKIPVTIPSELPTITPVITAKTEAARVNE